MAIVFPSSPQINDTHTVDGATWVWTGEYWRRVTGSITTVTPTLAVSGDFTVANTHLHVDVSGGQIGAGTNTPTHAFHIANDLGVDGPAVFNSTVTTNASVSIGGHVIPDTNITYDLGSATNRFRDIYLSGSSINLGDVVLSATATGLSVEAGGNPSLDFATESYVDTAISNLIGGAPDALNTLNELAVALDNDESYASTITTALAGKIGTTATFGGDVSGTYDNIVIADDSHNHIISNVDGLQTALDGKLSTTGTAADSSKLGGLSLSAGSSAPSGSQVIRSHTNGYTYLGWINTVSGATTSTISRIYASNDAFVRYVTPATFRSQIINGQAISPSSVTASGDINANGNMYVGKNNGGDSNIFFYDDNTNTRRTFQWDDSFNDWRVEDNGGTMRTLWHGGNSSGLAVAATTVSASTTYTWYLLNMPSGVNVYNLVSISPVTGVNNILYISEVAWGEWATVQTTSQIRILCRLGNGVHTDPFYINFYYKKDS